METTWKKILAGCTAALTAVIAAPAMASGNLLALRADSPLTAVSESGCHYILGPAADGEWTLGDFFLQFENADRILLQSHALTEEGHTSADALRTGDDVYEPATGETAVAVVKGDLLGNGKWSIAQLVRMAQTIAGTRTLTQEQELAADISGDGRVQINDLVQMAQHDFTEVRKDGTVAPVGNPNQGTGTPDNPSGSGSTDDGDTILAEKLLSIADKYVGTPYALYTAGPDSFDCSGFVWYVLNEAGFPCRLMSSANYSAVSDWMRIEDAADLQPGDLVFFKSDSGTTVSHVGFYAGNGNIIHAAPSINGVGYSTMASGYYARNFVLGRRLF
ncbi:MAG: hypothetical protein HDQ87_01280 [Clostridia bacterium]|nr:hypothetical protein [Clostridia bacterium]